jgi:3-dehydroquinate synthase
MMWHGRDAHATIRYNPAMKEVSIQLPTPPAPKYSVVIGSGLLESLGERVKALAPAPTCGIVTDSNVAKHYLARAKTSLAGAGYRVIEHVIPAGEQHKTLGNASAALDALLHAKVERATPVIALGGGVVGDLGGFVAESLLRGVPFVQAPTTLLSAVDASVGGKVGVDHAAGKNLIGAFHQPKLVLTDISTFRTLPTRELQCGLAECIKHAVIRDAGLFDFIERNAAKIAAMDEAALADLVAWNVRIKAAIVEEDPFEKGVRALLNLGHTFGHAIENVMDYAGVQHGEAVALGMVAAGRLANKLGKFPDASLRRMIALIGRVGLPTSIGGLDPDKTYAAMFTDKKVSAGKLRLILPTSVGSAEIAVGVAPQDIESAIRSLTK